jgi:outer membrane protein OmpA-like peptidoglycan-associated protein
LIVLSVSGRESASLSYDRIYTVCFRFGQATPIPAGIEVTEQIVKEAKEHLSKTGVAVIAVRGHASRSEPDVVQLSRRRAEAIRDSLREAGISRDSFA